MPPSKRRDCSAPKITGSGNAQPPNPPVRVKPSSPVTGLHPGQCRSCHWPLREPGDGHISLGFVLHGYPKIILRACAPESRPLLCLLSKKPAEGAAPRALFVFLTSVSCIHYTQSPHPPHDWDQFVLFGKGLWQEKNKSQILNN